MDKKRKIIITSVVVFIAAAAIIAGIILNPANIAIVAPVETPAPAAATETPASAETPLADPAAGEESGGFDEYNGLYAEHMTFNAGESTVVTAGNITKDCGAEPIAFEGATLAGYIITYSDLAHTDVTKIDCSFAASEEAFNNAGLDGPPE